MKIFFFLIVLSLVLSSFSCDNASSMQQQPGFVVVELFTSEGCSSCPPADKAVEALLKEHNNNIYVLGYHVDYWDNLGWKDVFSNAAYTQIQRGYAKTFKLSSVYTPQIVVNGTEQFVGSNEKKLNDAVNKDLQQASASKLNIDAKAGNGHEIAVHYSTDASNANLHIALIQLRADNKIQRGENSGATLHHVNIVRNIKTVPAMANGNVILTIPENLNAGDCRIIAFTQSVQDNKITGATEATIK